MEKTFLFTVDIENNSLAFYADRISFSTGKFGKPLPSAEGVAIVDNTTGDAFKIGKIYQDAFSHIKTADDLCRDLFSRMLYKDTITKFTKISEIIKNGFVNAYTKELIKGFPKYIISRDGQNVLQMLVMTEDGIIYGDESSEVYAEFSVNGTSLTFITDLEWSVKSDIKEIEQNEIIYSAIDTGSGNSEKSNEYDDNMVWH